MANEKKIYSHPEFISGSHKLKSKKMLSPKYSEQHDKFMIWNPFIVAVDFTSTKTLIVTNADVKSAVTALSICDLFVI